MIRKLFLIFIGMLLLCGCASATDYYVSPTGTGDGLTIETPGDPSVLDASLVAGDTMYFCDGTYQDKLLDISNAGTSENRIYIRAYSGTPTLNYTHSNTYNAGQANYIRSTSGYITIDGLSFTNGNYSQGLLIKGDYTDVLNCTFDTWGYNTSTSSGSGMAIQTRASHINIINCTATNAGYNVIQITLDSGDGESDINIENCNVSYGRSHNCIDLFNNLVNDNYYLSNISIKNNTLTAYSYCGIVAPHGSNPLFMENVSVVGNVFNGGYNALDAGFFRNGTVKDNSFTGTQTGYAIGGNSDAKIRSGTTIENNSISDSATTQFYGAPLEAVTLYRNNIYDLFLGYGNISVVDHGKSDYTVSVRYLGTFDIKYSNGTVFQTTPAGTGYTESGVSYTPTGSIDSIVSTSTSLQPEFTVNTFSYSAVPAAETATITPRTPTGSEECNFTANSTNGNLVTFAVWDLTPGYQYSIEEDGVQKSTQIANATGYITWNNDAWSEHVYTVEDTGLRLPVCAFTANVTDGTAPETVQFTDASTQTPTSWSWDFNGDDVEDSTEQNPVWTYDTDGSYDVSLTVTNAIGSDTETKTDYIKLTNPYVTPIILTTVAAALLFMRARRRW